MLPAAAAVFEKLPRILRRHRLMTTWMRLTGEPALQLVRIRDDSFGYADMSDAFLRLIVIDQGYERDFFRVADTLLSEGGTFLDAGANHGLFSFGLAGRHRQEIDFHLFEPNATLVRSIRKTKLLYPTMRMTVTEAAVTDSPGVISFEIDHDQSGASHISAEGAGIKVQAITLDDYLDEGGIARVELLKLDVEGYELSALRGGARALKARVIQAVYFEYFEKWLQRVAPPAELLKFLDALGFEVCFCRPCDFEPRGGPTRSIAGKALPLLPVAGHTLPAMTDLIAVPREFLEPLGR
ncbi:MAG: FkbM family methyltransferase [Acidobacteriota bacterium]|nr:FkbM family methyltransferase [Acidobacteriota bacterium]